MEFLRFGSTIPGSYWGCCACDVIQDFNQYPDAKASIQLVTGDTGSAITNNDGVSLFAGPTYHDIFKQRIRVGTFDNRDMPNHGFLAILTAEQLEGEIGQQWLVILKAAGFEFIRSVSNSVYGGPNLYDGSGGGGDDEYYEGDDGDGGSYLNHIFGLFRNIGNGAVEDPFTPPQQWLDIPSVVPEMTNFLPETSDGRRALAMTQRTAQTAIWNELGPATFMTEKELEAQGVPVWLAGLRSENKQELKSVRASRTDRKVKAGEAKVPAQPGWAMPIAG